MNKRGIVCLGIVLTVAAVPSFGQYGSGGQTGHPKGRHERMGREQSVDDRVKYLTKELNLTEEQRARIKSALEDEQKWMSSLKQDSPLSPEDRRAKFEEIKKDTSQQIRRILNKDQLKKYDELQSKHGNWREHRKSSTPPSDQQ